MNACKIPFVTGALALMILVCCSVQAEVLQFTLPGMKSQDEGVRQLRMVKIPAGTFLKPSKSSENAMNSDLCP